MADWSGEPAYKQLAEDIRTSIADGRLPIGTKLPSIADLMQQYGVSITVVRMAISALRSEGLIETHQGKGAFVISDRLTEANAKPRSAEYETILKRLDALQHQMERLDERIARLEQATPPPQRPRGRSDR